MKHIARAGMRFKEAGFTIVELIIATLIFSVILLLLTAGIIQITHSYYKGVIETNTQNVARNIVESIGQAMQFSKGTVQESCAGGSCDILNPCNPAGSCTSGVVCEGNISFSYILSKQLTDSSSPGPTQTNSAMRQNAISDTGSCLYGTDFQTTTGTEMLSPNMRLTKLTVQCVNPDLINNQCPSRLYRIDARVVYGDDDLLCSPSAPGGNDCSLTTTSTHLTNDDLTCKTQDGSHFCAVSEISSTVERRLAKTTED
jgi:type II secretory pathway pseudopilin PulG